MYLIFQEDSYKSLSNEMKFHSMPVNCFSETKHETFYPDFLSLVYSLFSLQLPPNFYLLNSKFSFKREFYKIHKILYFVLV